MHAAIKDTAAIAFLIGATIEQGQHAIPCLDRTRHMNLAVASWQLQIMIRGPHYCTECAPTLM